MYVTAFKRELFLDIVWAFLIKQLFHSRFVGYEIVIANSATPRWISTISYPTRARGIIVNYYMTKTSGRYNARSDWLRARSEQGITQP